MLISRILELLEAVVPPELAMPDDPCGLQVLPRDADITDVAVVYELTHDVLARVISIEAGLIIAFHPLIYSPLKSLRADLGRVQSLVIDLVRHGIGLHVLHTAFDAYSNGTSRLLGRMLGLQGMQPLLPHPGLPDSGMGIIGMLPEPITVQELATATRIACGSQVVRMSHNPTGNTDSTPVVQRVAIVGGSGMGFLDNAMAAGADVFITADVRYHGFHQANDTIPVIDPGHAEMERFVIDGMADVVRQCVEGYGVKVHTIDVQTNPVEYIFNT